MNSYKTKTPSKRTTRGDIEGGSPVAECAAIGDQALIRLIADSDELMLRIPGTDKPSRAIRRFGVEIQHLHRAARLPASDAPSRAESDLSLKLCRLDLATRARRHPLAGRVIRHGPHGPRVTAIVILAPTRVDRWTYRLAA